MARSIGGKDTAATALALFEQLRLREPLARALSLGEEITENGWRAAARVRLAFLAMTLTPAKVVKAAADDVFAGLSRAIWDDANARWLLKVNEADGEWYFNKELHEQMLWWMQLPDLLATKEPAKSAKSAPKANGVTAGNMIALMTAGFALYGRIVATAPLAISDQSETDVEDAKADVRKSNKTVDADTGD